VAIINPPWHYILVGVGMALVVAIIVMLLKCPVFKQPETAQERVEMARLEVTREALAARLPPEEIQAIVATTIGEGLDGGQEGSEIRVSLHEERSPEMSHGGIGR